MRNLTNLNELDLTVMRDRDRPPYHVVIYQMGICSTAELTVLTALTMLSLSVYGVSSDDLMIILLILSLKQLREYLGTHQKVLTVGSMNLVDVCR